MKISQDNGNEVDTIIGDSAYSGKDNLDLKNKDEQAVMIVAKLNPSIAQGFSDEDKFDYNKDADMFVCPADTATEKHVRAKRTEEKTRQTLIILTLKNARSVH